MDKREKEKEEIKQDTSFALVPSTGKKRFCDLDNSELLSDSSCPKCGVFYHQQGEGKHELRVTSLDGRESGAQNDMPILPLETESTKHRKMNRAYEALERGAGFKFLSYSSTGSDE